jgi:hypothetical protein
MESAESAARASIESIETGDMEEDIVESSGTATEIVNRAEVEIKLEPESPAASPASLMFESGRATFAYEKMYIMFF